MIKLAYSPLEQNSRKYSASRIGLTPLQAASRIVKDTPPKSGPKNSCFGFAPITSWALHLAEVSRLISAKVCTCPSDTVKPMPAYIPIKISPLICFVL